MSKPLPAPTSLADLFSGGGEMGRRMREFDWSAHPLGPPERWPQSLKTVIRIILSSRYAMWLGWGPEFYFFCNDAYAPTLGLKRDSALGVSARLVWAEIWEDIGPRAQSVMQTGAATWDESLLLFLQRSGYAEETYHTFSYSPVPDDDGMIGGMLCVVTEETERVIGERRLTLLRTLGADLAGIKTEHELFAAVEARLAKHSEDLPFALVYLLSDDGKAAQLACAHHTVVDSSIAPRLITLGGDEMWPATALFASGATMPVEDLEGRFADLPAAPWDRPPRRALLVPIAQHGQERSAGFLVAGLNPYRPLDAAYSGFLDLLTGQIAAGLASVRAYDAERRRAEALAEIDRAKTDFFSNVSHEFRTPLTLLLGPLEEIVAMPEGGILPEHRALAQVAHRNALRLLKLVNSLLDFSRIEAGRTRARFEPVDLAGYTADLASTFRSAMERAGLDFILECAPLAAPVYVDREMWEKIVLNLLSNAFKFTLEGKVCVSVRPSEGGVELTVRDTGAGIPAEALPHLFERFYRVRGVQGRTHEGSGIGLALIHELVTLHGGTVRVESEPGRGTTFRVTLPLGSAHLPREQCAPAAAAMPPGPSAAAHLAEALRWLPEERERRELTSMEEEPGGMDSPGSAESRPKILLADDNADMRAYVARLLTPHFQVTVVADGLAALEAARDEQPDLVLSDVMMPGLDGFALLHAMRADPALHTVPLILLSARAGEEARIGGLEAGADDYLIKPFQARELLARVQGTLALARARAAAFEREAELRAERSEILDAMGLPFLALDDTLRISYWNAEAARLHGGTSEEKVGRSLREAFPEWIGAGLEPHYRRALAEQITVRFDHFHTASGMWFEITVNPMSNRGLGVYFRDITARKDAEEALRNSQNLLRSTIDALSSHVAVLGEDGTILEVNEAWKRFADANGFLGGNYGVHSNYLTALEAAPGGCGETAALQGIRAVIAGQAPRFQMEYPCHSPTEERWFLMTVTPFPGPGPVRAVVAHENITDRVQATLALREAKEQAEAANRSKDHFLAVLSHELRTPLTPVLMAVASLEHDPELRPDVREDLAMMRRNIELETKLIDDLLDLNRITSGKLPLEIEEVALNEVVQRVSGICQPQVREKGIQLDYDLGDDVGLIFADPARLQQVLWNVLRNAIKFTPEGGRIVVTTARLDAERCEIRVSDSGIGIPPEVLPRIFDAFEQGPDSINQQFGGLGLGLAICKALVDLHGGWIRAESAGLGHGATFTIILPTQGSAPSVRRLAPESGVSMSQARPRLLLVEDHPDTAQTLARLLRRSGFAVTVAGDVASALTTADREPFDVLLSDLGLPDGSGNDLIRRLRESREVRGIAMSGFGMDEDLRRSREAGFAEHLIKPLDLGRLEAAIRRVMDGNAGD